MQQNTDQKLYMMLLGCKPKNRHTEQHDVFFAIGKSLKQLVPEMKKFWQEGQHNLHIDAWREVLYVDNYKISISTELPQKPNDLNLFFINLGGYEKGVFDELHHRLLIVATTPAEAMIKAKSSIFFKNTGFPSAKSHIDDKYEVDELINVKDILPNLTFHIHIEPVAENQINTDEIYLGYFKLDTLKD